jgi:hypothetical protein
MDFPAPTVGAAAATRTTALALTADVVAVLAFAAIGRSSHEERLAVPGVLGTATPFLIGLLVGWGVGRVWRDPAGPVLGWWAVGGAAAVGLALRYLVTDRLPWTFVLVAAVSLAVMLQSWRIAVLAVLRGRRRSI